MDTDKQSRIIGRLSELAEIAEHHIRRLTGVAVSVDEEELLESLANACILYNPKPEMLIGFWLKPTSINDAVRSK